MAKRGKEKEESHEGKRGSTQTKIKLWPKRGKEERRGYRKGRSIIYDHYIL
jgi:hypothetical protein